MILRSGKWPVKKLSLAVTFCFFFRGFRFFFFFFSGSVRFLLCSSFNFIYKENLFALSYLVPDSVLLRHELDDAVDEQEGEAKEGRKEEEVGGKVEKETVRAKEG